jgi:hypothetical protein
MGHKGGSTTPKLAGLGVAEPPLNWPVWGWPSHPYIFIFLKSLQKNILKTTIFYQFFFKSSKKKKIGSHVLQF